MNDYSRLIEHAFPLRQASIDSVHEKNVRHGHISTLHIWPARRPLAASRAALLATLLPDPGTPEGRKALCEKIGGILKIETDKEGRIKEVTEGGILRWKRETENKALLNWFREEIRKANGGRAPRFLDPFAGGGAIPLEAMRLGCDVTAADLNPVAWFILKCTLEYPQKLAGQKRPLPDFILQDREFMEGFLKKVKGLKGAKLRKTLDALGHRAREGEHQQDEWDFEQAAASAGVTLEADLAWHVRAWGRRVLAGARKGLAHLYPTYAEWQPLEPGKAFEPQPMRMIEPDANGVASADKLNSELGEAYLLDKFNPRWLAKPTVAYLWARTVTCKNCRAAIPLLKTRWLCRKEGKRTRLLTEVSDDGKSVAFTIEHNVPDRGGNAAQKREHDKKLGAGTMSRAGAQCPCCPAIMETEDIRYEGKNGRLGQIMTAVVLDGPNGKEYRLPTQHERSVANLSDTFLAKAFETVPFGIPDEPLHEDAKQNTWCIQYGVDRFDKVFTRRQLLTLGTFVSQTQAINLAVRDKHYTEEWVEAIIAGLAIALDRMANYASAVCIWESIAEEVKQTFLRFAIPMAWDYAEGNPLAPTDRFYAGAVSNVFRVWGDLCQQLQDVPAPSVIQRSAVVSGSGQYDVIITDPPYYDAIGYSVLMDFFYVWLRRTTHGLSKTVDAVFVNPLAPKWDDVAKDGELVDDAARHGGNKEASKRAYEDGIARSFQACYTSLADNGRFVIVFAHKHPDAWETLVSAIIRAGFVVDGSWPIQTEMRGGIRNFGSSISCFLDLACLSEARSTGEGRLGQSCHDGNARKHRGAVTRVLGCRDSRPGLCVGGDRPGDGGLQQISGGKEGEQPDGRVFVGEGISGCRAAHRHRVRRGARAAHRGRH